MICRINSGTHHVIGICFLTARDLASLQVRGGNRGAAWLYYVRTIYPRSNPCYSGGEEEASGRCVSGTRPCWTGWLAGPTDDFSAVFSTVAHITVFDACSRATIYSTYVTAHTCSMWTGSAHRVARRGEKIAAIEGARADLGQGWQHSVR